jgi:hypothetical protein
VHDVRSVPDAQVDIFASDGAIHDACYDDSREGDTERDFAHYGRCGAEGGRCDVWTRIIIYHSGYDEIERNSQNLHKGKSFGEVAGILEFGGEGEEGYMAGCTLSSRLLTWRRASKVAYHMRG